MKIEIKLPDPKYCDGCPLALPGYRYPDLYRCKAGYRERITDLDKDRFRPAKCVEENGE